MKNGRKGNGYIVEKYGGPDERYESFQEIADRYYLCVKTVAYWFYVGAVSRMGRECGIKAIRKA